MEVIVNIECCIGMGVEKIEGRIQVQQSVGSAKYFVDVVIVCSIQ